MKTSKILFVSVFFFFFPLIMTVLTTGCSGSACDFGQVAKFYDIKEMLSIVLNMPSRNSVVVYDNTKKISYDNLLIGLQVSKSRVNSSSRAQQ